MHQEEQQIGSYRLHKQLEQGIIADAYLATQIQTNKQVIVKAFQVTLSGEQLAECMAYIRACTHLEHPGILPLLNFGEESRGDASTLFLIIDTPDERLRQRHPQGLPLPLDTIALYVSQIASTLQFAHNQQILHLNLSPEQLFVGPNGRIMLDYTSRLLYSTDPTFIPTDALYTPHEPPSPASDQYALAMIIYEWLSGTLPFSKTANETSDKQRTLPVPDEHVSTIWSRVEQVLNRALALDPAQRYENVQAFADAFIRALNVGSEAARRRQEIQRQFSLGGNTSFSVGAMTSMTMGYPQTAANWHNPFGSGFSYTMHNIRTRDHAAAVLAVAWSPDSKRIASSNAYIWRNYQDPYPRSDQEASLHIWTAIADQTNTIYGQAEHPGTPHNMGSITWSPDGQMIAIQEIPHVRIYDTSTGEAMAVIMPQKHSEQPDRLLTVAWSPDGTRIAGSLSDGRVQVWSARVQ